MKLGGEFTPTASPEIVAGPVPRIPDRKPDLHGPWVGGGSNADIEWDGGLNRLFFFAGYQGTLTRQTVPDRIAFVPTADAGGRPYGGGLARALPEGDSDALTRRGLVR